MPMYDTQFGEKINAVQEAIGFWFPPTDFQNKFLASLLDTTQESMSRKKNGKRRVTESDWSRLTDYFDLGTYGFEPGMFAEPIDQFRELIADTGRRARADAKPNKASQQLFELAAGPQGGSLQIIPAVRAHRGGGIGALPDESQHLVLRHGDKVTAKVSVPADGCLILINDSRGREATCLMPSYFAPEISVRRGQIVVPTALEHPHFGVGGPAGMYRLYAIWFRSTPDLMVIANAETSAEPRDLTSLELTELAAVAMAESQTRGAVMVASADYEVG